MEAIFLDIDGTLWDSTYTVAEAWNKVLVTKPWVKTKVTPDVLKGLFGKPLKEIGDALFHEFAPEVRDELIDACCEHEHELLREKPGIIFDGVCETIQKLATDYKICIISNCEAGYIELVMEALGIASYITDFECPGYSGLDKGDNIKLVMKRNNFHDVVYVGDTQGDLEACRKAGIPFIYCSYGFGNPHEYDIIIDRFSDLPAVISGISVNSDTCL